MPELRQILKALIFISDVPLTTETALEVIRKEDQTVEEGDVFATLEALVAETASDGEVFEIRRINGGYQYFTRNEYYPWLRHAALLNHRKKLSRAALEVLSIVAYRQPVTKPEIEHIRGVNCDYAIQKLLDRKLIDISGRSDAPGKPLLYKTSEFFMEYFGLFSLSDLPKLQEFPQNEEEIKAEFRLNTPSDETGEKNNTEESESGK